MKIAVIGTGYVGLVSGVCFSKIGHEVICVDRDEDKINKLKSGIIPIFEPGLTEILEESLAKQVISFTTNLKEAVVASEAIFIAVGTPQDERDGSADLSFVYKVAEEIALAANGPKVIITKSTVPVGTGEEIKAIIQKFNPDLKFSIASNPEFLREGSAIEDFMDSDRIVVGVGDEKSKETMSKIYDFFEKKSVPIVYTDIASAELIKYASNSFLSVKIAFINEMADLCEKIGGNIKELSLAVGLDSRIGPKFLNPGPGFGGSCFPKDILALTNIAEKNNSAVSIVSAVISANDKRKLKMVDKIINACDGDVGGKNIAVLGLAFKANTDDIRYSPSLVIIKELIKKGAKIQAYDSEAVENTKKELGENSAITYYSNPYKAAEKADALVIATEWPEFAALDLDLLKQLQKNPTIIDLRNMLDAKKTHEAGFKYSFIGGKI